MTPSTSFETVAAGFATGLTGTIGVQVIDNAGATSIARATAGITEYPAGSGIYQATLTSPAAAGQYTIVWDNGSVTPGNVATEDLVVGASSVALVGGTVYVSATTLKATLGITNTALDADITAACEAASRAVEQETGRVFTAGTTAIYYYDPSGGYADLQIDDLATTTSLAVDVDTSGATTYGTSYALNTDYFVEPYNAAQTNWPYTSLRLRPTNGKYWPCYPRSVRVTGVFGWPAVPGPVVEATGILAARLFKRAREAPFSVFGYGADGASIRISRTDPDVALLLEPYSRRTLIL